MTYRTGSCFYIPRRKSELIDEIIKSGNWNGTKQALKDMETKQVRAIFISIRNGIYNDFMKKQSASPAQKTQKTEVENGT